MDFPILSSLILLPILGALFIFFSKSRSNTHLTIKYLALFVSFANFILSLYLWYLFDPSTYEFQFLEERSWIKGFINYKVGIDGISILFIILTTFITPLCVISVNNTIKNKKITNDIVKGNLPLYNFLKNKWYFDELYDYLFVNPSKKIGLYFWKKIDLRFIDRFGPDGISALIKSISLLAVKFQNGFIYHYAFVMLLGFSALLTFLILK